MEPLIPMFQLPKLESYHIAFALDEQGDLQGFVQIHVEDVATGIDLDGRMALDASSHLVVHKVAASAKQFLSDDEMVHPDELRTQSQGEELAYSCGDDKKLRVALPDHDLSSGFYLGIWFTCVVQQQSDIGVFTFSSVIRDPTATMN